MGRLAASLLCCVLGGCLLDVDGLTGGSLPAGGAGSAVGGTGGATGQGGRAGASAGGTAGHAGAAGAAGGGGSAAAGFAGGGGAGAAGSGGAGAAGSGGAGAAGSGGAGAAGSGGVGTAGSGGAGAAGKGGAGAAGKGGAGAAGKGGAGTAGKGGGGAAGKSGASGASGAAGCGDTTSDPANCGQCGRDCLGGTCAAGRCAPVVAWTEGGSDGGAGVTAIALDASDVYWTTASRLRRQPRTGGATSDLGAISGATALASAGGRLFIATSAGVVACDLPGCTSRETLGAGRPTALAVDASSVYWTDGGTPPDLTDGTVQRCGLFGCGAPTILTLGKNEWNPSGVAVLGATVYFVDRADPSNESGTVRSVPATGAGVPMSAVVHDPIVAPQAIAAFGGRIYWTETGAQAGLRTCDPASCTPEPVVQDGASPYPIVGSRALAVDALGVVWTNDAASASGSTVLTCPVPACAGAPTLVKSGLVDPGALAAGGSQVFFGDASKAGTLYRWVR
ncbi:MAG: hypothetical protein IT374_06365 [Polyangiaceae bacterium]|nr:hypothetical protein [Polyangiaceae bacterium]